MIGPAPVCDLAANIAADLASKGPLDLSVADVLAMREFDKFLDARTNFGPDNSPTIGDVLQDWLIQAGILGRSGGAGPALGGSTHLGMYVTPAPTAAIDGTFSGGGYVEKSNGFAISDSAGTLAPGTLTPSLKDVGGGGGIGGSYDASYLVPGKQGLVFSAYFDYASDSFSFGGGTPGLAALGVGAGSARTNTYTFGASATYRNDLTYLKAAVAYDFGHGFESLTADGSTGNFNSHGYMTDLNLGHLFVLSSTSQSVNTAMATKMPPRAAGGSMVGLDLSAHVGYDNQQTDSYTDSTGFMFGTERIHFGDTGGRAKLLMATSTGGVLWIPYVAGSIDRQFAFSNTLSIPIQATVPGGNLLTVLPAETFYGTDFGVDVRGLGWTAGLKGFYEASADTNAIGGSAYVKIPLNFVPIVKTRY